ncbi:MAG: hypothetical protein ACLQKA_15130 [Bryobacteraceae bacterium]
MKDEPPSKKMHASGTPVTAGFRLMRDNYIQTTVLGGKPEIFLQ